MNKVLEDRVQRGDPSCLKGVEDMVKMDILTVGSVLHNLRLVGCKWVAVSGWVSNLSCTFLIFFSQPGVVNVGAKEHNYSQKNTFHVTLLNYVLVGMKNKYTSVPVVATPPLFLLRYRVGDGGGRSFWLYTLPATTIWPLSWVWSFLRVKISFWRLISISILPI